MSMLEFYFQVVKALEEIDAPYMIVGAFAGYVFGVNRVTHDIDMIVDLRPADIDALAKRFPLPRYYADPDMMRNSIRRGIMFNLLDTTAGSKVDLIPLTFAPDYENAFARRIRKTFKDDKGQRFDAWCARPTDIIIGKLKAWTEGRSAKHPADIFDMLIFSINGFSDEPIDADEISRTAETMGSDTLTLWLELVARAKTEAQHRPTD